MIVVTTQETIQKRIAWLREFVKNPAAHGGLEFLQDAGTEAIEFLLEELDKANDVAQNVNRAVKLLDSYIDEMASADKAADPEFIRTRCIQSFEDEMKSSKESESGACADCGTETSGVHDCSENR